MQITLVQSEIEEAITAYVLGQLSIRDDQRISVDLKATRGEGGFQAIIDITAGQAAQQGTKISEIGLIKRDPSVPTIRQAVVTAEEVKVITTHDLKRMRAEEEAAEAAAEAAASDSGGGAPPEDTTPAPEPEPVAAVETPLQNAPPKKLFAGFQRPNNAAAAAQAS